jgi:hypothetical protein
MPLTGKGEKIMKAMKGEYGAKKGESVFYASKNKGKIHGVESREDAKRVRENLIRNFARKLKRQSGG